MPNSDPHRASVSLRLSGPQLEAAREHLVGFIEERATTVGAERAVVGLAGGVDGALTASLAAEALGADAVRGLVAAGSADAPDGSAGATAGSSDASDRAGDAGDACDAEQVARQLGIDHAVLDVDPLVDAAFASYPDARDDAPAVASARARLQAVLSSLVADHEDALVLGTADRTAVLLGPAPGASAVDCLPLGNLYTQQVRQLARHVGVPDDVVTNAPTAERRRDRGDVPDPGLDGDALDAVLALSVDGADPAVVSIRGARPTAAIVAFDTDEPLSVAETAQLVGLDERAVERVRRAHAASERDRRLPAVPEPLFRG